jgi:CheY-like chemotaxis protein
MEKRSTILLIDDDPRNIFALSAVLRSKGYNVITAPSAQEGLSEWPKIFSQMHQKLHQVDLCPTR